MKDLDIVAFGVFGSECPPGAHIRDFAKDLNGLRFPLLVDRVGILDFKTRNDAAMRQGNAICLFRGVLQGNICPPGVRAEQNKFVRKNFSNLTFFLLFLNGCSRLMGLFSHLLLDRMWHNEACIF